MGFFFKRFVIVSRDVYSLCVAHPESLADKLYAETKQYLIDHVSKLLNAVQEDGEGQLVKNYYHFWSQYSEGATYLQSLYLYLNQQHIKTQKLSDAEIIYGSCDAHGGWLFSFRVFLFDCPTCFCLFSEQMEIGELALEVWRAGMIAPLGLRLVKLLLEAIDQDRAQHTTSIPIEAVRGTIISFVQVRIAEIRQNAPFVLFCFVFFCFGTGTRLQEERSVAALSGAVRDAVSGRERRAFQTGRRSFVGGTQRKLVHGESYCENRRGTVSRAEVPARQFLLEGGAAMRDAHGGRASVLPL